ncbi:MAG: galactose-1-phosphate uridylyltransferase [Clostridiales bacterium]|nr:galactose-1-phosphate uridylyltransferase [Clostridiales bacterium]
MTHEEIKNIIAYAKSRLELDERDEIYKANRISEIAQSGLDGAELEDAIFGELSLLPSAVNNRFEALFKQNAKSATDWLYNYCINNKYIKKSVLDKNQRFETANGLIITINKAKPEFRDPNLAKNGNRVEGGFAKCVICRQNEGNGEKNKRNLRTVSLTLGGEQWFWQYSPYGYFNEHGIAVSCKHSPMHIDGQTLNNLLDFVNMFPHYFIGCNAALPRIGGSVLAHDHYQGGGEVLPLHKTEIRTKVYDKRFPDVTVGILDWPGTVLRIKSDKRNDIIDVADRIRQAWIQYNNPDLGIIARDENGIHNAISPTVIKTSGGYEMNIILRSNITSEEYPDGVFHAHPEYHAIKKESIGLIEAQGLFILPGRLEEELNEVQMLIVEKQPLPEIFSQFKLVYDETKALYESGRYKDVKTAMRDELGSVCYRILQNTAVFKDEKDFIVFLKTAGFEV